MQRREATQQQLNKLPFLRKEIKEVMLLMVHNLFFFGMMMKGLRTA
ncbi:hypothetical protein HMPREF9420_1168 [Segatella salivae DSM 15606]|uniref:Uncharacterized protein n=1 Tax=Segatella salivae DSM 15606 TaxID=888832 RepID=E6MNV0_9BACT|nr:hypothetical protein HMPREF9420_1168 [Segatella salivae DSM 15606]